jgi:type II secretory pathway pseudopilin PulG
MKIQNIQRIKQKHRLQMKTEDTQMKKVSSNKEKEYSGITLLALVVTIIILLILAGVTLSSITGNNGILTRTKEAVAAQDEANRREYLDQLMLEYSMDKTASDEGITDFLNAVKTDGRIQDFTYYDGELVLKYGGYYYLAERQGSFYKIARRLDTEIDGGSILISRNNIKNAEGGKITLKDKDSVVVLDTVDTDNFNFDIPAGATVTIKLMDNMNIDNSNTTNRSAINLGVNKVENSDRTYSYSNGATLNLYVYGNVTVDSSYGENGESVDPNNIKATQGGEGAYAGIRVPETATLNLYGTGTLISYGGNAGNGGNGYGHPYGGGGRRPELVQV